MEVRQTPSSSEALAVADGQIEEEKGQSAAGSLVGLRGGEHLWSFQRRPGF